MLLLQKVSVRRKSSMVLSNPYPHPLLKVGRIVGTVSLTFPLFQTPAPAQDKRRHVAGLEQPSSSGLGPPMAQMSAKQTLQVGRFSGPFWIGHVSISGGLERGQSQDGVSAGEETYQVCGGVIQEEEALRRGPHREGSSSFSSSCPRYSLDRRA